MLVAGCWISSIQQPARHGESSTSNMDWLLYSWPTLILLGLGLRMALSLTYGARGPEPGDPVHVFLTITSWVLIALGLAPAVLAGIFTFFGVIIVLLAVATLVEAIVQRRIAQR